MIARANQNQEKSVLTPADLARHYDGYIAACRRGATTGVDRFDVWLESFWGAEAPPEPNAPPDALSVLGNAGIGIRWYAHDSAIFGYVPGRARGCYRISIGATPPSIDIPPYSTRREPRGIRS